MLKTSVKKLSATFCFYHVLLWTQTSRTVRMRKSKPISLNLKQSYYLKWATLFLTNAASLLWQTLFSARYRKFFAHCSATAKSQQITSTAIENKTKHAFFPLQQKHCLFKHFELPIRAKLITMIITIDIYLWYSQPAYIALSNNIARIVAAQSKSSDYLHMSTALQSNQYSPVKIKFEIKLFLPHGPTFHHKLLSAPWMKVNSTTYNKILWY